MSRIIRRRIYDFYGCFQYSLILLHCYVIGGLHEWNIEISKSYGSYYFWYSTVWTLGLFIFLQILFQIMRIYDCSRRSLSYVKSTTIIASVIYFLWIQGYVIVGYLIHGLLFYHLMQLALLLLLAHGMDWLGFVFFRYPSPFQVYIVNGDAPYAPFQNSEDDDPGHGENANLLDPGQMEMQEVAHEPNASAAEENQGNEGDGNLEIMDLNLIEEHKQIQILARGNLGARWQKHPVSVPSPLAIRTKSMARINFSRIPQLVNSPSKSARLWLVRERLRMLNMERNRNALFAGNFEKSKTRKGYQTSTPVKKRSIRPNTFASPDCSEVRKPPKFGNAYFCNKFNPLRNDDEDAEGSVNYRLSLGLKIFDRDQTIS